MSILICKNKLQTRLKNAKYNLFILLCNYHVMANNTKPDKSKVEILLEPCGFPPDQTS